METGFTSTMQEHFYFTITDLNTRLLAYLQVKITTAVKKNTNFGCVAQKSPCS